jgi:surfeit locus 1 family protein
LWHWRDLWAMRWGAQGPPSADRLATMRLRAYAPFTLDLEREPLPPGGFPRGGATVINRSNRHLEYAVTWYGLALTLVGVFWAYARSRSSVERAK